MITEILIVGVILFVILTAFVVMRNKYQDSAIMYVKRYTANVEIQVGSNEYRKVGTFDTYSEAERYAKIRSKRWTSIFCF